MAATLAELLTERTKEDELESLRSVLKSAGFPVTDWETGGAGRTMMEAVSSALADKSALVADVAAGGYVTLAKDLAEPTWLDLLGEQFYGLERARATFTKQRVVVECEFGLGPQTINTGFIVRAVPSGRRYIYQGPPVEVPDDDEVAIEVQAESPGSEYRDVAGTIVEMVTPLPGLSVSNPQTVFGANGFIAFRNAANQGSGAIVLSGAPIRTRAYTVTVTASGSAGSSGAIEVAYEEDGARSVQTISPIPASSGAAGDGITMTFSDGVGSGWIKGDIHTFETPESPILANGVDDESQESYANRCLGRWPSLGLNIVADKYVAWVRQASLENAIGIEKITPLPSATVAGQTDILVATATGAPSGSAISTIQAYLNARDGITDTAAVAGAVNQDISLGGTVTVKALDLLAAQTAADVAWQQYIEDLPIGGDVSTGFPGVVRLSELVQALMDAGAIDYTGLTLNSVAANRQLAFDEVAVIPAGELPSQALTWVTVA